MNAVRKSIWKTAYLKQKHNLPNYMGIMGIALGLESAFLDNIDTDIKESPEKAWKVLQKWRQKKGKEATMGILINALEKIERKDVVDKLHGM